MRVLVLGATGMLGHKVLQRLAPHFETAGTVRNAPERYSDHPVLEGTHLIQLEDVTNEDKLRRVLQWAEGGAVINAVGVVKQIPAARDAIQSIRINALHPHVTADICRSMGARFIHMSTDCVFSGRKNGPGVETDPCDPDDLYGRSKLLGEVDCEGSVTIRTSIVGRELQRATGLFEWCISQRGKTIKGFRKAIYTGMTTAELSRVIERILADHPQLHGVWHVSSEPIDKCALLGLLNDAMDLGLTIEPDDEFVCDRSLDSSRFRRTVGYTPPSWAEMVGELAADPTPYQALEDISPR